MLIVVGDDSDIFERIKALLGPLFEVLRMPEIELPKFELPEWFVLQLGKPIELPEFVELLERKWPCVVEVTLAQVEAPVFSRHRIGHREHQSPEAG